MEKMLCKQLCQRSARGRVLQPAAPVDRIAASGYCASWSRVSGAFTWLVERKHAGHGRASLPWLSRPHPRPLGCHSTFDRCPDLWPVTMASSICRDPALAGRRPDALRPNETKSVGEHMPRIDIHTHFQCLDFVKHLLGRRAFPRSVLDGGTYAVECAAGFRVPALPKIIDMDAKLRDLEALDIAVSVLSHGLPLGPDV